MVWFRERCCGGDQLPRQATVRVRHLNGLTAHWAHPSPLCAAAPRAGLAPLTAITRAGSDSLTPRGYGCFERRTMNPAVAPATGGPEGPRARRCAPLPVLLISGFSIVLTLSSLKLLFVPMGWLGVA